MMFEYIALAIAFIGLFIIFIFVILLIIAECYLDTVVRKEMKKYKNETKEKFFM